VCAAVAPNGGAVWRLTRNGVNAMRFGQSFYGRAVVISLVIHGALLGLAPGANRLISEAPIVEAVPVEVIPSKVLSAGEFGDAGGMGAESGGSLMRQQAEGVEQRSAGSLMQPQGEDTGRPETASVAPQFVAETASQAIITDPETVPVLRGNAVEPELAPLAAAGISEQTMPQAATSVNGAVVNEMTVVDGQDGENTGLTARTGGVGADSGTQSGDTGAGLGVENDGGGARLLDGARPKYPAAARKAGWEGTVLARVLVDTKGKAALVSVRQSSGYSVLDEAVRKTVKKWRFVPATQGGVPVSSFHDVKVRFRLDQK
jgi:protein TonB